MADDAAPSSTVPPRPGRVNFIRAFFASAFGTGLSRVLGAARDFAIAGLLGAGAASDAFWVAFTVPALFRRFVADEGLTGALVPALANAETQEGEAAPRELAAATFGALLIANVVIVGVGIFAAEPLVLALAWSYQDDPEKYQLTVSMTRWMFPFVAMVSFVSFFEGLLNYRGHFFVPKLAPGLVSAGIVGSVVLLGSQLEQPVYAVVIGVLAGGLVHVLVNVPPLLRRWGRFGLTFSLTPRLKGVLRELSKVVAIGLFAQINIIVLRQIATSLEDGSVTQYQNGVRIVDLAQGTVAVAIGSALLPNLASSVASESWDQFRRELIGALRLALFLLVPVAVVVYVWAEPLTALLFRHGRYTWSDIELTAGTVRFMVPFLLALAAINILKRIYHALDDRTTLLVVGGLGVLLTGTLGAWLVRPFGISGLALGLSLATIAQCLLYLGLLQRRLGSRLGLGALPGPLVLMVVASLPVIPILQYAKPFGVWEQGPWAWQNWATVAGGLGAAGLSYLVLAWVLRLEEVTRILGIVSRRLGRRS